MSSRFAYRIPPSRLAILRDLEDSDDDEKQWQAVGEIEVDLAEDIAPPPRVFVPESPIPSNPRLTIAPSDKERLDALLDANIADTQSQSQGGSRSTVSRRSAGEMDLLLPEATFQAASQALSKIYANVIFGEEEESLEVLDETSRGSGSNTDESNVSWEPTNPSVGGSGRSDSVGHSRANVTGDGTFLRLTADLTRNKSSKSFKSEGRSTAETQLDSQSIEEDSELNVTEGESITRFPTYHFSLHRLSALGGLLKAEVRRRERRVVAILVAVLEVDGPNMITTKAGVEMGILKLIVGDDGNAVAKVVIWRETALAWGGGEGGGGPGALRKGDVVLLENVAVTYAPPAKPTVSASPNERPIMTICYRTLPIIPEDRRYRPDLRLAQTDPALRRVAVLVDWIEEKANIHHR